MKKISFLAFLLLPFFTKAQKIKNIYINLYTDSLKKGTYNYINVDGLLPGGNYTPLDSSEITFWCSDGQFYGNTLLVDKNFSKEKITIKVTLKQNPNVTKEFTMYIKLTNDEEKLKTTDELIHDLQHGEKTKKQ